MMVSPEWYAEGFLEGKSPEEILAKIKELEREIRRLRRVIASPNYKNQTMMICPDKKVQLEMYQEYLKLARQLYMDSIEHTGKITDCGGIQPLPILPPMDEEE